MTATLLKSKAPKRDRSISSAIPDNIPLPSLPLFGWVSYADTAGYETDDEEYVSYDFVDRGQVTGIKWNGRKWLYTVQFYAEYATHSDGSTLSSDEEIEDFDDQELTPIPDPRS